MLRAKLGPIAAAALAAILATTAARAADDTDVPAAPAGAPVVNATPDTAAPGVTHETQFGTEFRQPIGQAPDDHPPVDPGTTASGSSVAPNAPPPASGPPASAARHDDDPGAAISNAAEQTGRAIDHGTKGFRDGAEKFFNDVGHFFSGDK